MNRNFRTQLLCCFALLTLLVHVSCKKNDVSSGSFSWTAQGNNYTATQSRALTITPASTYSHSINGALGNINHPDLMIGVHSIDPGNYTLADGTATITYRNQTTGSLENGTTLTVHITARSGSTVSGNFTAVVASGAITGSFSNVLIQ